MKERKTLISTHIVL